MILATLPPRPAKKTTPTMNDSSQPKNPTQPFKSNLKKALKIIKLADELESSEALTKQDSRNIRATAMVVIENYL